MVSRPVRDTLLTARGLTYRLAGQAAPVLDGVDLTVNAGELLDVTGPSGSGKTTLLRALARLLPGAQGDLELEGEPAASVAPREWRARVALLPQVASMRPGTVRENLVLPWTLRVRAHESRPDDAALQRALSGVGLGDVALDRDAAKLSVGQAARVSLLRVTLTCPRVLLLDEPDANLDDESAAQVALLTERFAADGGGVVRVRHLRREGTVSRTVRIADGTLEEVGA